MGPRAVTRGGERNWKLKRKEYKIRIMDSQIDTYYEDNLDHTKYCFVCGTKFEDSDPNRMTCSYYCYQIMFYWGVCSKDWMIWKDLMRMGSSFRNHSCRHVVYMLLLISIKNRKKRISEKGIGKMDLNTHEPTENECAQVVRYFRDDYDVMPPATKRGWREDAQRFLECWQILAENRKDEDKKKETD